MFSFVDANPGFKSPVIFQALALVEEASQNIISKEVSLSWYRVHCDLGSTIVNITIQLAPISC